MEGIFVSILQFSWLVILPLVENEENVSDWEF